MLRSTSRISSSVRNTVPKLMGMMVWAFITVSMTCSWARAFSRVGSKMKTGVRLTTAAMSPWVTTYTISPLPPIPIRPKETGSLD